MAGARIVMFYDKMVSICYFRFLMLLKHFNELDFSLFISDGFTAKTPEFRETLSLSLCLSRCSSWAVAIMAIQTGANPSRNWTGIINLLDKVFLVSQLPQRARVDPGNNNFLGNCFPLQLSLFTNQVVVYILRLLHICLFAHCHGALLVANFKDNLEDRLSRSKMKQTVLHHSPMQPFLLLRLQVWVRPHCLPEHNALSCR